MASPRQTENTPQRKATRPVRRQQLIDSTIAVLARKGYAGLTVADVAKEAGLSAGIVIFHFNSKDELLAAVLGALATEYRTHWEASMNAAGPAAADRLKAMLLSDFDTDVYTRDKLAAWVAFWTLNAGLILRAVGEPVEALWPQALPPAVLQAAAVLQVAAAWIFVVVTWPRVKALARAE